MSNIQYQMSDIRMTENLKEKARCQQSVKLGALNKSIKILIPLPLYLSL